MPFTVQDFRSQLIYQGQRPNLFDVVLPFPTIVGSSATQKLTFMCKAASIPPQDKGVIEVPYFGRKIKVPGDRTFPEWTLTIINDEDFLVRNAFERWSNAINMHFANLRNSAARLTNSHQVDGLFTQYTKIGTVAKQYNFVGCWPSNIAAIDTAWDNNDSIGEFTVTLQYQWWESTTTS